MSARWRNDGFLATWSYGLSVPPSLLADATARAAWLADLVARLFAALDGFARPERAALSSRRLGEDALTVEPLDAPGQARLRQGLRDLGDLVLLDVDLALTPSAPEGPLEIPGGGEVMLDGELDDDGRPLVDWRFPFHLRFSLHVDLYATGHAELGALNAPALRALLRRIEETLPVEFQGVEAERHPKAHRYGLD